MCECPVQAMSSLLKKSVDLWTNIWTVRQGSEPTSRNGATFKVMDVGRRGSKDDRG